MIAVVMGAPDSKTRSADVQTLMTYGFGVCNIYIDENTDALAPLKVEGGVEESVPLKYESEFRYLDIQGSNLETVERVLDLPEAAQAPAEEGSEAGRVRYYLNGAEIGSVPILYGATVEKAGFLDYVKKVCEFFLL